jgi:hypothetical protein
MDTTQTCIRPACNKTALKVIELESSLSATRYFCPECGRQYTSPTTLGKVAQVAPLVSVGLIATAIILGNWDDAADHVGDLFN